MASMGMIENAERKSRKKHFYERKFSGEKWDFCKKKTDEMLDLVPDGEDESRKALRKAWRTG